MINSINGGEGEKPVNCVWSSGLTINLKVHQAVNLNVDFLLQHIYNQATLSNMKKIDLCIFVNDDAGKWS